eukprot:3012410-Rhodomonas_salina.2
MWAQNGIAALRCSSCKGSGDARYLKCPVLSWCAVLPEFGQRRDDRLGFPHTPRPRPSDGLGPR